MRILTITIATLALVGVTACEPQPVQNPFWNPVAPAVTPATTIVDNASDTLDEPVGGFPVGHYPDPDDVPCGAATDFDVECPMPTPDATPTECDLTETDPCD
jgi:hypothetical protein